MGAVYYRAESESGDHIEEPSEDALFMLIDDLNGSDNTFVVIQPEGLQPPPPATQRTRRSPL
ncbi:hypothetical protein OG749_43445 [Streptomyces nojiriensis]|uniref:hypothetical protein n=1 Tax=Streptomyces nojiriensis TaxID=66374 RepID=UPI002E197C46